MRRIFWRKRSFLPVVALDASSIDERHFFRGRVAYKQSVKWLASLHGSNLQKAKGWFQGSNYR